MNSTTPHEAHEEEEQMRRFLAEAGDPNAAPPSEHVARLRSVLIARLESATPRSAQRSTGRLLVGSVVAVLAISIVVLTVVRPEIAWAQVAKALQDRPWVHGTIVDPEGKKLMEQWFNSNRELGGERAGTAISFHDYKQKVCTKYVADENTVYRLNDPPGGRPDSLNFLRQVIDTMRDPQGPGKFPFPGAELITENRREINDGTKTWLEITLTLRIAGGQRGETESVTIRVDPATKLPVEVTMVAEDKKRYSALIDYPDDGPADIYDLGVPRTAKVVDRMLSDEVRRVLSGLKAGRHDFEDYCAIVVEERIRPTYYVPMTNVLRVWRKGPKFRIERLRPEKIEWAPPPAADAAWWREHQRDFEFVPKLICNGSEYWDYYLADSWKEGMPVPKAGKRESSGQTIGPNQLSGPADDPVLPFWLQDVLPEQNGHPTAAVAQPDSDREFLVEDKAGGGPPGTILLRGRDTNTIAKERPDHFRLWVDPQSNYLSMKTEIRVHESKNVKKVAWIGVQTLEEVGKSPGGHSYPTRSRHIYGTQEMVRKFFVDFTVPLPDNLFEPLK